MVDIDSKEFNTAVKELVREVLRNELSAYSRIFATSIVPVRADGSAAQAGDVVRYSTATGEMEVGP